MLVTILVSVYKLFLCMVVITNTHYAAAQPCGIEIDWKLMSFK